MRVRVRAALVRIADNRDCFCGGLEDKGNLWPRRTKPLPLARRLWNSFSRLPFQKSLIPSRRDISLGVQ